MTLSTNQLVQSPIQGMMDLRFNPNVISAEIDSSEAGTLLPGQAVKIVDSAGGVPKVIACAADTDDVFGFIAYDIKSQGFVALDKVELAVFAGCVMYMTASAAIARWAQVEIVIASKKVATAASGKRIVGRAYDKAAGDGSLIRVFVNLPGALVP